VSRPIARGLFLFVSGLAFACATGPLASKPDASTAPRDYWPDRRDYSTFQSAQPDLIDPNYLPFMVHRLPGDDPSGDYLVLCRWDAADMPLRVYIGSPQIPEDLQDEFQPIEPMHFVRAVEAALLKWEAELEGLVGFTRVESRVQADLELVLVAEAAPEEDDRRGLGRISLSNACRVEGEDPDGDRLRVRYRVGQLQVYLADPFGLLSPNQVESIAMHEIGHALGMRSHSPIPADLMHEVMRDRHVPRLSIQDVNSFVSLYKLENGSVFGHVPPGNELRPQPGPPPVGPPLLERAPYVDPRLGFNVRPPEGWMRMETAQGMLAVDGTTWDYTASFQVIVHRYDRLEDYLARFGAYHLTRGQVLNYRATEVAGKRAIRALVLNFDGRSADQITLIEVGDGRVISVIADCPAESLELFQDWFEAALASLEIWPEP
jgi:hypothetical protein